MKITVTGRHRKLSPSFMELTREKLTHLEHYLVTVQEVSLVLDGDARHGFTAEAVVKAPRGQVLVGKAEASTLRSAVDAALHRVERQLVRCKERLDRSGGRTRREAKRAALKVEE